MVSYNYVSPRVAEGDLMLESGLEKTIIGTGIALWFAYGWHLNERLRRVHEKLDVILNNFNGLQEYLYEIDPQFDEERQSREAFENNESLFSGMNDMELRRKKEKEGKRTLNTSFVR